jgi:hypothetical protein
MSVKLLPQDKQRIVGHIPKPGFSGAKVCDGINDVRPDVRKRGYRMKSTKGNCNLTD